MKTTTMKTTTTKTTTPTPPPTPPTATHGQQRLMILVLLGYGLAWAIWGLSTAALMLQMRRHPHGGATATAHHARTLADSARPFARGSALALLLLLCGFGCSAACSGSIAASVTSATLWVSLGLAAVLALQIGSLHAAARARSSGSADDAADPTSTGALHRRRAIDVALGMACVAAALGLLVGGGAVAVWCNASASVDG